MKLADKYRPTSDFQLPSNPFYNYFGEELFYFVCATTPDSASDRVSFEKNGRMVYNKTNEENDFYDKKYISISALDNKINAENMTLRCNNYYVTSEISNINNVEQHILDFIYNGGHRLIVTGKKGWGKTTLMRYMAFHVLPTLNKDSRNKSCTTLYISFDSKINDFEKALSLEDYEKIFYEHILLNEVRKYCMDRIGEDITSDFYQYLLSKSVFSREKRRYNDITKEASKGWITSDERDKRWHELRKEISEKKETIILSFAYFSAKNTEGSIPVIFLDDLDPLDIKAQSYIYNEVYKLAHEFQIKIVVAMRPRSYERVFQNTTDALQARTLSLTIPKLELYLQHKVNLILQKTTKESTDGISINNVTIRPQDTNAFFQGYTQALLQNESINFLISLSDGNLRICNDLIHTYLSSGYVNSEETLKKIIEIQSAFSTKSLPMWVIYSSIITNNHQTVFGRSNVEAKNFVVNILCNGKESINVHLIRLHLLALFMRSNHTPLTISNIIEKYAQIAPDTEDWKSNDCKWNIHRVIKRFANARLIGNNNRTRIPDKRLDSIVEDDEFYLEELGRYYYSEMPKIFEYLSYMKDDMDFGDNTFQIKDSIEIRWPIDRFLEVVKYLHYLHDIEFKFCNKLSREKLAYYISNFSPVDSNELFYVQSFIDNMIRYAETRKIFIEKRIKNAIENELDATILYTDLNKLNVSVNNLIELQKKANCDATLLLEELNQEK